MPIVNITTWPTPQPVKEKVMQEITKVIHDITGAPLDKITVYFQEIEKQSWSEAGILGSDETFPIESRRKEYNDE